MAEPIRISALGRDAQVGDLYNYLTDVIVPSGIDVPNERKTISDTVGDPKLSFIYQQPEKSKRHFLGINSHLLQNMKRGSVPGHQLWFSDYLNTNSMDGDEGHAQVTLLFRVVRRTETLDLDFLRSKIDDYQLKSTAGGATHVIDEVVYGAEVICSMRKALDLSQETKESAEVSIYFAAKKYLDETIVKSTSLELPIELDQVSCTFLSSIKPGKKNEMSFHSFNLYLQNLLDTGNNRQKCKPMEFLLRNMSAAHIEAKLCSERKDDVTLEKEHHQVNRKWITKEMLDISNDPSLKRFPLLEKFICYFRHLLPRFWKGIDETYKTLEMLPEEKVLEEMIYISDWLKKVMDLFACWRKDIREMCWLLKDTDLVLLEMQEIEAQMTTKDCKIAKLFVLNLDYKQVLIVKDIEELVGQQTSTAMLPVLPIFLYEKEQIGCIRSALSQFANEARLAKLSSSVGTSYYVGLESSTLENGAAKIVDYSGISPIIISEDNLVEYLQMKQKHQLSGSSSSVSACLPPRLIPSVASDNQTTKRSISRKEQIGTRAESNKPNLHFDQISLYETNVTEPSTSTEDKSNGQNQTVNRSRIAQVRDILQYGMSNLQQEKVIQHHEKCEGIVDRRGLRVDKIGVWNRNGDQNSRRMVHGNTEPKENRRIAEIYIDERYSTLIKKGSPNIYLLNALKKSNSDNNKWFDICRPGDPMRSRNSKVHKIIILVGATGSGKSTLINGMVNYILGVKWNDPFRFMCVREDENTARNQAHSQTSSVMAYTLHHQEGMTIPYSITIIDTPGYGNTGGVKRDKEISAAIHSFLTQQEIPIDEIHAACFVAASGDSRLTATQRYIIDSVLSIFGKDMKDNLRLLVTFADNADPPVVGACLSANFPTTSASDGIAYSKFNSSVLYCSNAEQGDDELSFDQLFWDMGHENFKKFFYMLERMKGRDLTSTREVIHSRRQLEQSLKDIEQEMEVCLTNIENIEILQRKMKTCGHNMEATKNFTVEQTVMRPRKYSCEKGFFAYNCEKCRKTCERRVTKKSSLHKEKRPCENKACKCPPSDHCVDEWEWFLIPEKVSMTLQDVKAQYELNYDDKMTAEKILNACTEDLLMARAKVLSLVEQVAENVRLLESTALRSNVLSPSDYLSLMRSRVQEEQAPGYMTRLETLDDIQRMLAGGTSQPIRSTAAMPNQGFRLLSSNTERVSDSSVTPSYGQAYNKEPSLPATQPTPVYGDVSESKSGRSWTSKGWPSSLFGIGKPAESDNQSQQQKKKNETWKF
ncbi:uncharacterized protein LOC123469399 [Daphnia magna]|uniref:uncharacterized protein LOC123469399 n=1 Tax=Daphnia magna TaxID=35525 RepID=UPI001E1BACE2|nr:uncharacterized protein LOC123469399 [Daphnia magna]